MKDTKPHIEILVPSGTTKAIAAQLNAALNTVRQSLRRRTRTELSAKIRDLALSEFGGNYRRD